MKNTIQQNIDGMGDAKRKILKEFAEDEGKSLYQYLSDLYKNDTSSNIIIVKNSITGDINQRG